MSTARCLRGPVCLATILCSLVAAAPALADDYVGRTPPRLSLIEGQVSFWRNGAGDEWEEAQLNLPLAPGDSLYIGPDGRAEIQIGPKAFLRATGDTQIGFEAQDESLLQVEVSQGRLALDLRDLSPGSRLEVRTPHGKLSLTSPGFYDVTVDAERASFVARQGGRGTVVADGEVIELQPGAQVVSGRSIGRVARNEAPPPDDFERWNSERTDRILSAVSRGYVSEDVYGVNDLDEHGSWRDEPRYGRVWVPAGVPPSWAPYTTGRWLWDGDYGWSWVDASPWGWAPYHYGRWVWFNSYWGWAPGPVIVAPVYSPALVAFFGGGVSVSVGFPFVSWVALGWGEPVLPWWGPTWFRGRPCWSGWGGPTIINNVFVDRHRGRDHRVDHWRHQDVPDAVVSVRRRDFAQRSAERLRMARGEQRKLLPVRDGSLPVEPREAGVRESPRRGRPPRPDRLTTEARSRPSSIARQRDTSRDAAERPTSDLRSRPPVEAPNRIRPPLPDNSMRTRQRGESQTLESSGSPRSGTAPHAPGSENLRRPPRPERPMPARERPQRDRPPVQDAYSAPTYDRFDRAPRRREIPRGEMPGARAPRPESFEAMPPRDRPQRQMPRPEVVQPQVAQPEAPPREAPQRDVAQRPIPARPMPQREMPSVFAPRSAPRQQAAPAPQPRERSGSGYSGRGFERSAPASIPNRPQRGGGNSHH